MATNTPRLPGENDLAERRDGVKDVRGIYTDLAIRSGAMTDAGELSEELFRFANLVVEHCAELADADHSQHSGALGDRIRTAMGTS